jgi:hypothetical protein
MKSQFHRLRRVVESPARSCLVIELVYRPLAKLVSPFRKWYLNRRKIRLSECQMRRSESHGGDNSHRRWQGSLHWPFWYRCGHYGQHRLDQNLLAVSVWNWERTSHLIQRRARRWFCLKTSRLWLLRASPRADWDISTCAVWTNWKQL